MCLNTTPWKMYEGLEVKLHVFLTPVLHGGEWSASRPGRFTPEERASGTHWIGGWVGPCQDSNPGRLPRISHYTDRATLASLMKLRGNKCLVSFS